MLKKHSTLNVARSTMPNGHTLRHLHRWFALVAGLQMGIWALSGTYMVLMDIDFIRGNTITTPQTPSKLSGVNYPLAQLLQRYPDATQLRVSQQQTQAFYQFKSQSQLIILNADTGLPLKQLTEHHARHIALSAYSGAANIKNAFLLAKTPPRELNPNWLPVWQVNFADISNSSIYVSAISGHIVTKRHNYWRLFDVMWMLHIMDYDTRDNIHNNLLTLMACLGLLTAVFGTLLLWCRLRNNKVNP